MLQTGLNPATPVWVDPGKGVLRSAVEFLASSFPRFNWVGVYVLKGDVLELGPFVGEPSPHTRIQVGVGVCGTAVAENADQNVPDVRERKNYLACSLTTRSELVVLVRDRAGKILGQIDIDSYTVNAFGSREESVVREVAQYLGGVWPESLA
ncbi:MAG: GAF domain-containing protein [Bacteriovoracia bacterium]